MLAQFISFEFPSVRIHRVQRRKFQGNVNHCSRRFRHARSRIRIADRIESLVTNVSDDTYHVVKRVNFLFGPDLNLLWCATHKITQHLSPERFVGVVFRIHLHAPAPRVRCCQRECLSATVPLLNQERSDLWTRTFDAARFKQY